MSLNGVCSFTHFLFGCASGSASGACGAAGCGLVPVVDAASAVLACACSGSAVSGGDACGISAVAAGACWV